uniref:hypothetical protein n=1 Tax=uncultured Caulobacter sp. TaxID=158749 RepID=UPI0025D6CD31|nr:hypothetical protein [uncultured Caulobacter sp.]
MIAAVFALMLQAEPFLSGGWATDDANPVTAVSAGFGSSGPKFIYTVNSTYMVDALRPTWVGVTERGTSRAALFEGGRAHIEGVNVELRQTAAGASFQGQWQSTMTPLNAAYVKTDWSAAPNQDSLVADWDKPHLFVISYNKHINSGCTGKMKVIVDGQPLKMRSGAEINLLPGSSLLAKGTAVQVKVIGTCNLPDTPTNTPYFTGSLKALIDTAG